MDARDPRAIHLLPGSVARRLNVLPLSCTEREVDVATANPLSQAARRETAQLTGRQVRFQVASPGAIAAAVSETYAGEETGNDGEETRVDRGGSGPRILVVDDEAGQRALFRSILEEAGFRVDVERDGPAALEALEADSSYDLVTLDYWMDRMNGLRVLQQMRSRPATADLPVIMITGADDRRIEMSLFEAGADDYIAKPVDGPLFVLRVRAVLRRRLHA
jgi:PleD family two-component response regulator